MKSTGKLDRAQRTYYDKLVAAIGEEILTDADTFLLENAAKCYAILKEAEDLMRTQGLTQEFERTGAIQVSPAYVIWQRAANDFERYAKHFGLSPKARKDLDITEQVEERKDPLSNLRVRKAG